MLSLVANLVSLAVAIVSSSIQSEILGVVGKSILLPFKSKSPPNCGVVSSTILDIPPPPEPVSSKKTSNFWFTLKSPAVISLPTFALV